MSTSQTAAGTTAPSASKYGFRDENSKKFPEMVHIDVSTVCNFRCIHCPQGNPGSGWEDPSPLMMKEETFYKVVDEVSRHRSILRMTTDGEPTLHPKIKDFLRYVLKSDCYAATLTTNGSTWNDELVDVIMQPSKVKMVIDFSIDAIYRETFETIRVGGHYMRVLRNFLNIVDTRNRKRAEHLYLMVNAIEQPAAKDEIPVFRKFWEQIADRVIIRKYVNVQGLIGEKSGEMEQPPPERWPCILLWTRLMINPRGEIRFCIDDWNNRTAFEGKSIENTSIEEIWASPEYDQLRKQHLELNFCHKSCGPCRDWEGLKWDWDYRHALKELFKQGQHWGKKIDPVKPYPAKKA